MLKRISLSGLCALCLLLLLAGVPATPPTKKPAAQPKIMVIPKAKAGQELKALYDSDANIRLALVKIDEAFLKRGANIVSFDAKLKEATQNQMINRSSGNQEDFKSMVLQQSGADIYVEAEVDVVKHTQRKANSVTIILEGHQTGTGNILGAKEGRSRMVQTDDVGFLTSQAMDSISEGFLNLMQLKFDDIRENGQSMFVQFSLGPNYRNTFDSEVGKPAVMLSDAIDQWFQKNCVKGSYNNQGVTGNMLIVSDARMPLVIATNQRYTGQNLWSELNKFLRGLGLNPKREIGNNNKLLITLQ